MSETRQRKVVTIEQLLQLKRAERPAPEFWNGFESELRQRQLAALLKKRSWWHGMAPLFSRRAFLPAGASAILVLSLMVLRQSPSASQAPSGQARPMAVAQRGAQEPKAAETAGTAMEVEALPVTIVAEESPDQPDSSSRDPNSTAVAANLPEDVAEMLPWSAPRSGNSPSARSIAANLARLEQNDPEMLEAVLSPRLAPSLRPASNEASPLAVEMAAVNTGAFRRNSRLLASYNDRHLSTEPSMSAAARERAARRLADLDLADEVRRLDLKGSSVSLKL